MNSEKQYVWVVEETDDDCGRWQIDSIFANQADADEMALSLNINYSFIFNNNIRFRVTRFKVN